MTRNMQYRRGFTLVEMMVVIVIFGLLLGMGSLMMGSARRSSAVARTQAIISVIDEVIGLKLEELRNRPYPLEMPQVTDPNIAKIDLPPGEAALARLLMARDTMRMEMPDRYSDLVLDPTRQINQTGRFSLPLNILVRCEAIPANPDAPKQPIQWSVNWWENSLPPAHNIPGLLSAYQSRLPVNASGEITWSPTFASAECLYLILSTTFVGGKSALEMLPRGQIRDLDEDGVSEIVDAWDNPIGFIRWPVGYFPVGESGIPSTSQAIAPEEQDIFRADFAYASGATAASLAQPLPRSLRPLIVSAGPDGEFDLRFSQTDTNGNDIVYSNQTWPVSVPWVGTSNVASRPAPFPYIDPYLRQTSGNGLIGAPLDSDGDGTFDGRTDNVSNYSLAEEG